MNNINEDILNFGKHLKTNYIPTKNNHVPSSFISFIFESSDDIFFDFFNLNKVEDNNEFNKKIRSSVMKSLLTEISIINNDYYYNSFETNNTKDIYKLTYSLGFSLISKNISEKEFLSDKTIVSVFQNKEHGLLWEIESSNNTVSSSIIYGNLSKKIRQPDLLFMKTTRLLYSDIYGFSLDMKTLPVYQFELLLSFFTLIPKWIILPNINFKESVMFHKIEHETFSIPKKIIETITENFEDDFFNNEPSFLLLNKLKTEYPSVVLDFFLIDLIFDGYTNAELFFKYIRQIDEDTEWDLSSISSCAYTYFKYFDINQIKNEHKNDQKIIEFLEKFKRKELISLYNKKDIFINTFKLSNIVLSYLEMRVNKSTVH